MGMELSWAATMGMCGMRECDMLGRRDELVDGRGKVRNKL